jgi:hypothetical protein
MLSPRLQSPKLLPHKPNIFSVFHTGCNDLQFTLQKKRRANQCRLTHQQQKQVKDLWAPGVKHQIRATEMYHLKILIKKLQIDENTHKNHYHKYPDKIRTAACEQWFRVL